MRRSIAPAFAAGGGVLGADRGAGLAAGAAWRRATRRRSRPRASWSWCRPGSRWSRCSRRRCCWCSGWCGSRTPRPTSPAARWGRHKLAPSISPGKTWEGVAGGLVGAAGLRYHLRSAVRRSRRWAAPVLGAAALLVVREHRRRPVRIRGSSGRPASRTAARCCPAMAACSTASTARPPRCRSPRCCCRALKGIVTNLARARRDRIDRRQHARRRRAPPGPLPRVRADRARRGRCAARAVPRAPAALRRACRASPESRDLRRRFRRSRHGAAVRRGGARAGRRASPTATR